MTRDDIDREIDEHWLPLLQTNGQWDEQKIRNELHDLVFVVSQVSEVYQHITGGKLSKPMYYAEVIKAEFDDAVNKAYEDQAARVRTLEAGLREYGDHLYDCAERQRYWKWQANDPRFDCTCGLATLTGPAEDRPAGAKSCSG